VIRFAWLALAIACVSTARDIAAVAHRQQVAPPGWQLGGRYDDTRIIVMIGGEITMPQREAHALRPEFTGGRAQLFGTVYALSESQAREIVGDTAHVGDRWVLDAGRFGWFHVTVERFIVADWECATEWGVMASVVPDEQTAFAKITDKYFVLAPAASFTPPARTSAAGPMAFSPSNEQRVTLEHLLNAEFTRQWPVVHREDMIAWAAFEQPIKNGEAKLTYDVQAFRMTPDGEPRLFVRASWKVGAQVVFLMTAWVRAGADLTIDHVDVSVSRNRYARDFPSSPAEIAELNGLILGVLDTDRNGWGEFILMRRDSGHDAMGIDVLEYPQTKNQELRLILNVNLSC